VICVECRALLEECAARNGSYRRAVQEYRTQLTRRSLDSLLQASKLQAQVARESMQRVRRMYEQHVARFH
jgi:hypothetical protein